MLPDALISAHLLGRTVSSPRPSSWIQGVLLLRRRELECAQLCSRICMIEAPGHVLRVCVEMKTSATTLCYITYK